MLKVLVIFVICFLSLGSSQTSKKIETTEMESTLYPILFRDHIYYTLSNKGKEMFEAVDVHPLCVAKKGYCTPVALCKAPQMLYISRVCYKRDLVCCYDNTIKFPEVAWKDYSPPSPADDITAYVEPPKDPVVP